jgi:protein tyrosine/serine phosphatase
MKKISRTIIFIYTLFALCPASLGLARDPDWAEPINLRGAPNLHRVTENLYRGAQPTREGFRNLEKMGVKTVVNLRAFHGDKLDGTSLKYFRIRIEAWDPEMDEVIRVLRILTDESGGPYFVHCQHGADRTGMIMAVYRMAAQDWEREAAIAEMTGGGYGFHEIWREIPEFLRKLDVEKIKSALR